MGESAAVGLATSQGIPRHGNGKIWASDGNQKRMSSDVVAVSRPGNPEMLSLDRVGDSSAAVDSTERVEQFNVVAAPEPATHPHPRSELGASEACH